MDQIVAHLLGLFRVPVTKYGNPALAFVHSLLLLSNSCDKGSLHVQVVKDYHNQVKGEVRQFFFIGSKFLLAPN